MASTSILSNGPINNKTRSTELSFGILSSYIVLDVTFQDVHQVAEFVCQERLELDNVVLDLIKTFSQVVLQGKSHSWFYLYQYWQPFSAGEARDMDRQVDTPRFLQVREDFVEVTRKALRLKICEARTMLRLPQVDVPGSEPTLEKPDGDINECWLMVVYLRFRDLLPSCLEGVGQS
ncbi:MAG: hypothetical protein L6R42_002888 [Xanthoria sp. 1 TBL-2021]|nr:MAG: hypothetical protein L6R42_002888 [Xanthoria sp. 1 TBL-2021]